MRNLLFVGALLLGALTLQVPTYGANYGDVQYQLSVVDQKSFNSVGEAGTTFTLSSGVLVFVYDAGTKTLSTIYSNRQRTAKSNPISRAQFASDGAVLFYGAAASYDIYLAHTDGSVAFYGGVSPREHRLPLSRTGADRVLVFPMIFNAGGTEVDTGLDLPLGSLVYDAWVNVTAVDSGETVDVGLLSSGTNGDADGFLAAVSVATAGVPARFTYTTGSNETYLSAVTYGALLAARSLGNDVATDVGSFGKLQHFVTGSNTTRVTYTPSTSDTFVGYGYIAYKILQ